MKTIAKVMTVIVFAVGLLGIPETLAQRDYDPKTVETIGGNVLPVEGTTPLHKAAGANVG